jgi:hypothetical protein
MTHQTLIVSLLLSPIAALAAAEHPVQVVVASDIRAYTIHRDSGRGYGRSRSPTDLLPNLRCYGGAVTRGVYEGGFTVSETTSKVYIKNGIEFTESELSNSLLPAIRLKLAKISGYAEAVKSAGSLRKKQEYLSNSISEMVKWDNDRGAIYAHENQIKYTRTRIELIDTELKPFNEVISHYESTGLKKVLAQFASKTRTDTRSFAINLIGSTNILCSSDRQGKQPPVSTAQFLKVMKQKEIDVHYK